MRLGHEVTVIIVAFVAERGASNIEGPEVLKPGGCYMLHVAPPPVFTKAELSRVGPDFFLSSGSPATACWPCPSEARDPSSPRACP